MSNKIVVLIVLILILVSFMVGRYSVNPPAVKDTQIVTQDTQTQIKEEKHVIVHTITVKEPSGVERTETTTESDTHIDKDKNTESQTVVEHESTLQKRSEVNISGLIASDLNDIKPVYGLSVSKEIIGPITVGLFGFTNGTLGVSVGINF